MKLDLPDELKHKFESDKEWMNSHCPETEKGFKKTLPDKIYENLLSYYDENIDHKAIVELNKLGFKVIRESIIVRSTTSKGESQGGYRAPLRYTC